MRKRGPDNGDATPKTQRVASPLSGPLFRRDAQQRSKAMQIGQRVGPFDIEKQIGFGAMGAVYLARYRKNGKRVAIKVMHPGMGNNETAMARFEREGKML